MSEFKFACPICGQHITAGHGAVGSQISCPTCFRNIVIPSAPASADPKFILSASEVGKSRLPQFQSGVAPTSETPSRPGRKLAPVALVLLLVVAGAAGTTLVVFHDKIFKNHNQQVEGDADAPLNKPAEMPGSLQPATNSLAWALDLTEMDYPAKTIVGRIHGRDFVCDRVILQGGTLTLRHPHNQTDLGLNIYFFAKQAEELAGKSLTVTTNNTRSPRVVIRWKDGNDGKSESINDNYALKVEFGEVESGRIPGKIYVCLPDDQKSVAAGTFTAEIRKPAPPRPAQNRK